MKPETMRVVVLILAVLSVCGIVSTVYTAREAAQWKHAYESELEIRSNLDELLKEFRSVCAER